MEEGDEVGGGTYQDKQKRKRKEGEERRRSMQTKLCGKGVREGKGDVSKEEEEEEAREGIRRKRKEKKKEDAMLRDCQNKKEKNRQCFLLSTC